MCGAISSVSGAARSWLRRGTVLGVNALKLLVNARSAQSKRNYYLDGGKNDKLRIPANPPVKTFWSIFDGQGAQC